MFAKGLTLPEALEGTGNVSIELGVGRLPTVLLLTEGIFSNLRNHEYAETILAAVTPNAFLRTIYSKAFDSDKLNSIKAAADKAAALLRSYTDRQLGLRYYLEQHNFEHVDMYLNANGLLVDYLCNKISNGVVSIPTELTNIWKATLERELSRVAVQARQNHHAFSDFHLLAISRLVLGRNWVPQASHR